MIIVVVVVIIIITLIVFIHLRSICKADLWTKIISPSSKHVFRKVGNPFETDIIANQKLQNCGQSSVISHI